MGYDTEEVLRRAVAWRAEGLPVAVATVVRTWGSSPRPAGSKLAVNGRGEFVGSVSGGCIEGAVVHEARAVMGGAGPKSLAFGVRDEDAWGVGLACGGRVQVYVEAVDDGALGRLLGARAAGRAAALVTWLGSGERAVHDPDGPPESTVPTGGAPRRRIGGAVAEAVGRALASDECAVVGGEADGGEVLVEPFNAPLRLVVVGAVHVAQPLAKMAAEAGFGVIVVDPRKAFATEARFPGVALVRAWPAEALASLALDRRTAVVTLTHDPKLDDPALEAALRSPAFYVGCLGSQKTHRARLERLGGRGFDGAALARLCGPVGLRIGAKTPAEIAVSVLAQAIERLRAGGP